MSIRDGKNPLLSITEHGARNAELQQVSRTVQAEHKRILGRLEAELRVRLLQEKVLLAEDCALRPLAPAPVKPRSRWQRWFGKSNQSDLPPRSTAALGHSPERSVDRAKEQLARITETDNPVLLKHINATAEAFTGAGEAVPEVKSAEVLPLKKKQSP